MRQLCAVILWCAAWIALTESRGQPPKISIPQGNNWPEPIVYIRLANPDRYECAAKGTGKLTYKWQRNGADISARYDPDEAMYYDPDTGILDITKNFHTLNSGDYQCIVTNDYGTAMTPYLKLLATQADAFPGAENNFPENLQEYASNYLMMKCKDVPISVPPWVFSWEMGKKGIDGKLVTEAVQVNDRLVIDPEGSLHFLWVEAGDNDFIYSCAGENMIIRVVVKNTHTLKLSVLQGLEKNRLPELKYHKDVEVMAGEDAKLTCIFSYFSTTGEDLEIEWQFNSQTVAYGTTLTLPNVKVPTPQENQEGEYICLARLPSMNQAVRGIVHLKIVAPPEFVSGKQPQTTSFPVEKDAVFRCEATSHNSYARPPVWFVNSKPLIGCPPRFFECKESLPNGMSQCIHEKLKCDNNPDCSDESDETANCPVSCGEGSKDCRGTCILNNEVCAEVDCDYPGFKCHDGLYCLTKQQHCNGVKECNDGSDENGCASSDRIEVGRFNLNSQRTELVLPDLTLQDTMCFQCIVANDYGTVLGDGCIQVINKIEVLVSPNSTYNTEPDRVVSVGVDAVTDKDYQSEMIYEWLWYKPSVNAETGEKTLVKESIPFAGDRYSKYFHQSMRDKNFTIITPEVKTEDEDTTAYDDYIMLTSDRLYAVKISHKFDQVVLNFTVVGKEIERPVVKPVVNTASFNLWFIALILAILILFVVIALIICYMYRNRGGTYLLDKKEHQAGHDPEQELKDSGFHDVGRVGDDDYDDRPDAEKASLSESVKPYESDEDITEEYGGDFDVSKFNEDGSFIGLYGDKKSKYSSESKEATV